MSEYSFEPYKNSNADKAVELFSKCFNKARPLAEWLWQYHDCPHGQTSVACWYEDKMVGFYGVVLRPFFVEGKEIRSGHVLDVMTHPDHQGRGLFTSAAKAAFKVGHAAGVRLFFGWPNKQAWPGHRKVGWKTLGVRQILSHSPDTARGDHKDSAVQLVSWDSLQDVSGDLDTLFTQSLSRLKFVADRRWMWLRWRYAKRPGLSYSPILYKRREYDTISGWAVLRTKQFEGKKVGHIVDFLCSKDDGITGSALESFAFEHFAREECQYVQCLQDPEITSQLHGWRQEENRELPLIIRSADESGADTPDLGLEDWYLTLGDCDVF